MSDKIDTKVLQVSNIAPNATRDQMKTLFSYLGRIDEIKMYPAEYVQDLFSKYDICQDLIFVYFSLLHAFRWFTEIYWGVGKIQGSGTPGIVFEN
jgi:hypothetical protein